DRQLPAKRLLDRCLHGFYVARMPPAGHVDRRKRGHQRFLRAVGNGLWQLAHVAIQIYISMSAPHSKISSPEAIHSSCSRNRDRAVSHPTRSNRISSRGRSCPRLWKSAEITLAIFGYPPVVCCSTKRTMGNPPSGTWMAPSATPSETISPPQGAAMASPSNLRPMRLDSSFTR